MYTDSFGRAPEWWQWAISGVMIAGGITLIATGVGSIVGGALICAGVNSIIGSYISEALGGSSLAGWAGGMCAGIIGGFGAGFAGSLLVAASEMVGAACIKTLALSLATSFVSGSLGTIAGETVSASIDGEQLNGKELYTSAIIGGSLNMFAGLSAGIGSAITTMPFISETTKVVANLFATNWSVISESIVDIANASISLFN